VYAPEIVARAILYCAEHPKRDVFVGAASKVISSSNAHMPRMLDQFMNASMWRQQKSKLDKIPGRRDALHAPDPSQTLRERQGMTGRSVREISVYTAATLNKKPLAAALIGGGALLAAWGLSRRNANRPA